MPLSVPARKHRADLALLASLAIGDMNAAMAGEQTGDARVFRDTLADVLQSLVLIYADAAASLGADWYDELRDKAEVRGRFQAIVATLPDVGRTQSLAGWAVEPLFGATPNAATALTRAAGGLQKIVLDADRATVTGSSIADPQARGWQREGVGECRFCRMLIGRGAVYTEASVDFRSHDNCHCVGVPAFQ